MNGSKMLDALEYVSEDLILNAENAENVTIKPKRYTRKKVFAILAASVVILCGTAAASVGLFWNKPDVSPVGEGLRLALNQGTASMPGDEALRVILDSADSERNYKAFLNFDSVAGWQNFFGLPFVSSDLVIPADAGAWTDDGQGGLTQMGSVDVIVSTTEENGIRKPALMNAVLNVSRRVESTETPWCWKGQLDIIAAYSEEIGKDGSYDVIWENADDKSIEEYTTASGIPYIISQIAKDGTVRITLYYGYESVLYQLMVTAVSEEEAAVIREDMMNIAETLTIMYPDNASHG